MKIEKGYTSIQFGNYIEFLTTREFCELSGSPEPYLRKHWSTEQNALDFMRIDALKYNKRRNWDKFIMQPLKKEMFVNNIAFPFDWEYIPDHNCQKYPQECYIEDKKKFKEAEKKVIFRNWIGQHKKDLGIKSFEVSDGRNHIEFYKDGDISLMDNELQEFEIKTLSDLFRATNGELEIKNLEI